MTAAVAVHALRTADSQGRRVWWLFNADRVMKSRPNEFLPGLRRRWERTYGERIGAIDQYEEYCEPQEAERLVGLLGPRNAGGR